MNDTGRLERLLASMKEVKAERRRRLENLNPIQLVKIIEDLGHFKQQDEDIAWIESRLQEAKA